MHAHDFESTRLRQRQEQWQQQQRQTEHQQHQQQERRTFRQLDPDAYANPYAAVEAPYRYQHAVPPLQAARPHRPTAQGPASPVGLLREAPAASAASGGAGSGPDPGTGGAAAIPNPLDAALQHPNALSSSAPAPPTVNRSAAPYPTYRQRMLAQYLANKPTVSSPIRVWSGSGSPSASRSAAGDESNSSSNTNTRSNSSGTSYTTSRSTTSTGRTSAALGLKQTTVLASAPAQTQRHAAPHNHLETDDDSYIALLLTENANSLPPPGLEYYEARRALWLQPSTREPQTPMSPSPSRAKLEALLGQAGAVESDEVWRAGLKNVWKGLVGGNQLRKRLPLGIVLKILQAGWLRDGTWPEGAVAPSWDEARQSRQSQNQGQAGSAEQADAGSFASELHRRESESMGMPTIPPGYTPSASSSEQVEWGARAPEQGQVEGQGASHDYTQPTPPPGAEREAAARGDAQGAARERQMRREGLGWEGRGAQRPVHAGERMDVSPPPSALVAGSDDDDDDDSEDEEDEDVGARYANAMGLRAGDGRAEGG